MFRNLLILAAITLMVGTTAKAVAADRVLLPADTDTTPRRELPPAGSFFVDEESWVDYMDEQLHEQFFEQAKQALARGDQKEAARQLKHGRLYLRLESGRGTKESKALLHNSEVQLQKVDDALKSGVVPATNTLDSLFASANFALARHHYLRAQENWLGRSAEIVGHDLRAAANEWLAALMWSGRQATISEKQSAYDIVTLANKMIDADDFKTGDVERNLASLGQQLDVLGETLR